MLLMTLSMKYLSPPEAAVLSLIQIGLGPLCVYAALGEAPSVWAGAAAVVLIAAVAAHEFLELEHYRAMKRAAVVMTTISKLFSAPIISRYAPLHFPDRVHARSAELVTHTARP